MEIIANEGAPPVSTTPVANLPPMLTTPAANVAKSTAGVDNTGGKFATGVNDIGDKFAAGVNVCGEYARVFCSNAEYVNPHKIEPLNLSANFRQKPK